MSAAVVIGALRVNPFMPSRLFLRSWIDLFAVGGLFFRTVVFHAVKLQTVQTLIRHYTSNKFSQYMFFVVVFFLWRNKNNINMFWMKNMLYLSCGYSNQAIWSESLLSAYRIDWYCRCHQNAETALTILHGLVVTCSTIFTLSIGTDRPEQIV